MHAFWTDLIFMFIIGIIAALSVGTYIFDTTKEQAKTLRLKQSVGVGAIILAVPIVIYLISYYIFVTIV